jgi:hypothetical protein
MERKIIGYYWDGTSHFDYLSKIKRINNDEEKT